MLVIRANRTIKIPKDPERTLGAFVSLLKNTVGIVHESVNLPEDSFEVLSKINNKKFLLKDVVADAILTEEEEVLLED